MHAIANVRTRYYQLVKRLGEPDFVREGSYLNPTEKDLEHCYDSKVSVMWGMDYEGKKEVEEKCLINGLEVSNIVWPFGKTQQFKDQNEDPRLNPTKKYIVQLHNGSYDLTDSPSAYSPVPAATNDTKLFLFDYLHGNADNIAERDLKKNEILDYLKYNYRDILLKSQSDLLIANSSTQTYKNFGLPLSHPYININYKS